MPNRWIPVFLLTVLLGEVVLVNTIKELLDRVRPTFNPIAETLGPSFPSGHSATAAAFYAAVALVLARRRSPRARALLAGAAVAVAIGVAASRVLLGVHWLSDVDRRPRLRLGLVRALRDRLRRQVPDVRRASGEGGTGGGACNPELGDGPVVPAGHGGFGDYRSKIRLCIGPSTRRRRRETPGSMTSRWVRGSPFSSRWSCSSADRAPALVDEFRRIGRDLLRRRLEVLRPEAQARLARDRGVEADDVHLGVVEQ